MAVLSPINRRYKDATERVPPYCFVYLTHFFNYAFYLKIITINNWNAVEDLLLYAIYTGYKQWNQFFL
jgi:hypothetical protein